MLRGAHSISLDQKGRIAIPTKYRDAINEQCGGRFVCTIDIQNPCLLLFPLNNWEKLEQKLSKISSTNPLESKLQRILLGYASDCELDASGRILIPLTLRNYAKLTKELMLVGQLNRFEIWSSTVWNDRIAEDLMSIPTENWSNSERLKDFSLNDYE